MDRLGIDAIKEAQRIDKIARDWEKNPLSKSKLFSTIPNPPWIGDPDYFEDPVPEDDDFIEPDEPEDWTEYEYADAADYYYGVNR